MAVGFEFSNHAEPMKKNCLVVSPSDNSSSGDAVMAVKHHLNGMVMNQTLGSLF